MPQSTHSVSIKQVGFSTILCGHEFLSPQQVAPTAPCQQGCSRPGGRLGTLSTSQLMDSPSGDTVLLFRPPSSVVHREDEVRLLVSAPSTLALLSTRLCRARSLCAAKRCGSSMHRTLGCRGRAGSPPSWRCASGRSGCALAPRGWMFLAFRLCDAWVELLELLLGWPSLDPSVLKSKQPSQMPLALVLNMIIYANVITKTK